MTSPRGELRDNAAASTPRGAGLASAHRLPGESWDWGRDGGDKGWRFRASSLTLVHRLQGLNALAEEAAHPAAKPESVVSAGEVARVALGGTATGSPDARP